MSQPKPHINITVTQSDMGGAQRYVLLLTQHLQQSGYAVSVAAGVSVTKSRALAEALQQNNITHYHIPTLVRHISPLKDYATLRHLTALYKTIKPDVVHVNSAKAGILGAWAAHRAQVKKIIYTAHGFAFDENISTTKKALYRHAERATVHHKTNIICLSQKDAAAAKQLGYTTDAIHIIPNGIDIHQSVLSKNDARTALGIAPEAYCIGTIANFYQTKDLPNLIMAFQRFAQHMPSSVLVIIGDGPQRSDLESLIAKLGIQQRVILTGVVPHAGRYCSAFDTYACSSSKEGFPFSILEAMHAGVPIISTNVGALPEILDNGICGMLVPPSNPAALAEALITYSDNPATALKAAQAGQQRCHQVYSLENWFSKTVALY